MVTSARIREELEPAGLDWISALKSTDIRKLTKGPLTADVPVPDAEIASPDFPGERLMVCFNPRLRDERRRKHEALLRAMEFRLGEIARVVGRRGSRLRGKEAAARRVGEVADRLKVSKHFEIRCEDDGLSWSRRQDRIDREAALDGIWVVRTSLGAESIGPDEAVEACKSLDKVEQAFRPIKTGQLRARTRRASPVEPARPSPLARSKTARKRTNAGKAVHSSHTLLADLSTVAVNDVSVGGSGTIAVVTTPTPVQNNAFDLLDVNPTKMFPAAGK